MASFWFHLALIMACLSSLVLNSKAFKFTNPPPSSFQQLSPEITPLLPSPGGVIPTPTTSSVSTIPSNPSPPNPDEPQAAGPAFSAFAPIPATSSASTTSSLYSPQHLAAALAGLAGCVWML